MDFLKLLEKQAKAYPHKLAVISRTSSVSFAHLKDTALQVSSGLAALGVARGDKVAIFLPNVPEYMYGFLGVFLLHGICVPLDFMLTEEEIVNFINHSESKVLIAQERKGVDLALVKSRCPLLKELVVVGQVPPWPMVGWGALLAQDKKVPLPQGQENDCAAIFYTSGSTGHPKGVPLSYYHFDNPVQCFEYFLHPAASDVLLCGGIPFSHVGGLDFILLMLHFGVTLVLMERFAPLDFLKHIEQYRVSIFCIVPSMYVAILSLKEYDKFDLSSLRYAVVFGAPSSAVLLQKFLATCPNAYLLNGWGMTETSAPNSFLPTGTNTKEVPHTGTFMPGAEVKIVDDEGNELRGASEGELWIRGKAVMRGYYKEPRLTAQVLTSDGWLKTGDVARRDAQGRYSIVGRRKEMIKVAGEIVFCPELEEVIYRHPKVQEVAVIGVADAMRGEVPKAFVVAKPGESLEAEELRFFLRQHLAHFKIPHHFEFTSQLPKNRVGKIDKEKLKGV